MKISEVTVSDVACYLRLEEGDYQPGELDTIMAAGRAYITGYTGLPLTDETGGETVDDHEDLTIAFLVLCQSMYDERTVTVAKAGVNYVVQTILDMHVRGLVG